MGESQQLDHQETPEPGKERKTPADETDGLQAGHVDQVDESQAQIEVLTQSLEDESQPKDALSARLKSITAALERTLAQCQQIETELAADQSAANSQLEAQQQRIVDLERDKAKDLSKLRTCGNRSRRLGRAKKKLARQLTEVENGRVQLGRDLEICRSDKATLIRERDQAEAKIEDEKEQVKWKLVRELAAVLADLSDLAGKEPAPVKGLKPFAVMQRLLNWMENGVGGRPMPFPREPDLADGGLLWLDPDAAGMDVLLKKYDWGHERPFDGLAEGERKRQFRLQRRGWSIGGNVILLARVTTMGTH